MRSEDRIADYAAKRARQTSFSSRGTDVARPSQGDISSHLQNLQQLDPQDIVLPFDRETIAPSSLSSAVPAMAIATGTVDIAGKATIFATISGALVQFGIPIAAVVLIGAGAGLGIASIVNNMAVKNQVDTYTSKAQDSGQTDNSATFVASKDPREPVKVEISDLSISSDTAKVGVNSKGNIGSPANIKQLAWFDQSTSPIDPTGTALIVGHVGSPTYAGALAGLYKIKEGANIKVTMGDGKMMLYRVSKIEDIAADKINMANYLPAEGQASKKLVIITCSGDYNARTYNYADRLIVTADATAS